MPVLKVSFINFFHIGRAVLRRVWNLALPRSTSSGGAAAGPAPPVTLSSWRSSCNLLDAGAADQGGLSPLLRLLRRFTHPAGQAIRRRVVSQLGAGNSAPFLALLGVSLASGNGLVSKEQEMEMVCMEARKAAAKTRHLLQHEEESMPPLIRNQDAGCQPGLSWKNLELGGVIAKGCSAVVHAAKWATSAWNKLDQGFQVMGSKETKDDDDDDYPLAVKMMFNYDVESDASKILKAMAKETIVADVSGNALINDSLAQAKLPPHPNIVKMYAAFADQVPQLEGSMSLYPDALPSRLNPTGLGRNMTLFLVMKRYEQSLRTFLQENRQKLPWRTSLIILTQLLEGLSHLREHQVCHRDLKTDNVLLDRSDDAQWPHVVITDFGCCLADPKWGLQLPFPTYETDRGGNAALMAPEVGTAQPGLFSFIDYSKADVWAAGALAYEIFGQSNPFYSSRMDRTRVALDSRSYRMEDLPTLPDTVPCVVAQLIYAMLERRVERRMSADMAANVCQLLLWAPNAWLQTDRVPDNDALMQWMLTMTTKLMYEARFHNQKSSHQEYQMVATFLSRFSLAAVKKALQWIHRHHY